MIHPSASRRRPFESLANNSAEMEGLLQAERDATSVLLNDWTTAAGITAGRLFRSVSSAGKVWGEAVTEKLVWHVVKEFAPKIGVSKLAPHFTAITRSIPFQLKRKGELVKSLRVWQLEGWKGSWPSK